MFAVSLKYTGGSKYFFWNQECHQQYNWHLNMAVKITTNSRIEMITDQYNDQHHQQLNDQLDDQDDDLDDYQHDFQHDY